MHPAPSLILFTTLSGIGFGLLAWLGFGLRTPTGFAAIVFFGLGYGLAGHASEIGRASCRERVLYTV